MNPISFNNSIIPEVERDHTIAMSLIFLVDPTILDFTFLGNRRKHLRKWLAGLKTQHLCEERVK